MIYFESLKINHYSQDMSNGLSLNLNDREVHYISSNNFNNLNSIYNLIKNKENYINGSIFIDNIDVTKLDSINLTNFYYKNISFCEYNAFYDSRQKTKHYINFLYSFNPKSKIDLNHLLKIFYFNSDVLDKRIKWLDEYEQWKLLLLSSILKETKYILISPLNYDCFSSHCKTEIHEILSSLIYEYNVTIIILQHYNNLLVKNNIDLDSMNYYAYNNRITIGENKNNFQGFNLIKSRFNIYKYSFIHNYLNLLIYSFISLILTFSYVFLFILLKLPVNQVDNINNLVNQVQASKGDFTIVAYFLFVINIGFLILITILMYRRMNSYLNFLSICNVRNLIVSLIIPTIMIINSLIVIGLSFLINILIFKLESNMNDISLWNEGLYTNLVYFLCVIVLSYIFILKANNSIKFHEYIARILKDDLN